MHIHRYVLAMQLCNAHLSLVIQVIANSYLGQQMCVTRFQGLQFSLTRPGNFPIGVGTI